MRTRIKYVVEDTDRHGNVRFYYRRKGALKVRLRGPFGSPEFWDDYRTAHHNHSNGSAIAVLCQDGSKHTTVVSGSLRELCVEYFQSAMFRELEPRTQEVRRRTLERVCQRNGDGDKPYRQLQPRHIRVRRDAMMDRPEAANGMIKALRQLFKFALRYDLHDQNPAAQVEYLRSKNPDGIHSWTVEEIEQYERTYPVGTKPRLALELALGTGQRLADLVQFGRQHVRDEWLSFTQHKGRNRSPVHLEIPLSDRLMEVIEASPTGELTFLVTEFNRPFSAKGFGNRFRKWCNDAGLKHCSIHGLRKAAAARLAELGCTEQEIMAITGHRTSKEVTRYTRAARQKTRAESALRRISAERK
ncbi:MAG: tyrosine-type recombinase/integrase [Devosiaceae bacterium]|nr:tyrosine-type recombinase/integrase [Devosiaceae bacterium MH13]